MGLRRMAARFVRQILDHLVDLKTDGTFLLDQRFADYCRSHHDQRRFDALFVDPPARRTSGSRSAMDLAASVQAVTEEIVLRLTRAIARRREPVTCAWPVASR
jgi:carbamoyltransferase